MVLFLYKAICEALSGSGPGGSFPERKTKRFSAKAFTLSPSWKWEMSEGQFADNLANGLASASEAITRPSASLHRLGEYTLFLNR